MSIAIDMFINILTWSGLFSQNSLDGSISSSRSLVSFYYYKVCFIEIPVLNANNDVNVDPDQTPHSLASDLGLHCLPITHLGFLN